MKLRDAQREIEKINYLGENNPLNDVINEGPWTKEAWRKAKRGLAGTMRGGTWAAGGAGGGALGHYAANYDALPDEYKENPWVDLGATTTGAVVGARNIPTGIPFVGPSIRKTGRDLWQANPPPEKVKKGKVPTSTPDYSKDTLNLPGDKPKPQNVHVTVNTPPAPAPGPDPKVTQLERDLQALLNREKNLEIRLLKAQQQGNDDLAKKLKAQTDSIDKKIGSLEKKINTKPASVPSTPTWSQADERAALQRLAQQGKVTGITDSMIAKEIANPTQIKPTVTTVQPPPQVVQQAQTNASQIVKQVDGVKISTTKPLAGSASVKIGGETVEQVSKQVLAKEFLEKAGIVTSASNSMFKQTLKQAAKKGSKYLALSFIPGLNIALWGHDAYAVTTAISKAIDPDTQDKVDAGRHRQVALQQMSQVMMSDAPMDAKIEQIEYLFSDKVTETTLPELQAQVDAGVQPQHFVTANPELQAQLDKGPQPLTVRNGNIWNSSYDDKEKIFPVTFDEAGNIAVGPNTKADFESIVDDLMTRMEELNAYRARLPRNAQVPPGYTSQVESVKNSISQARTAMKNAPDDRKTAFKNYVFSTLAQTEAMVAANESAILKGAMIVEGPIDDWMAKYRNWATDKEKLPKSGGAIRGKTSLGKRTKNLDQSELYNLKNVSPRHDFKGNAMVKKSGISTPGQAFYDPAHDIKDFKPDTVAQAKADYKKSKIKKPVLTPADIEKNRNMRKVAFLHPGPKPEVNVNDIKAKQTGKKVGGAISQAIGSIESPKKKDVAKPLIGDNGMAVTIGKGKGKTRLNTDEEKLFAQIKAKRKKYSKYSKAEQKLMMKVGLIQRTFQQAHAEAKADSANLKTMKLKNGKTLKYFVWNGKKYTV